MRTPSAPSTTKHFAQDSSKEMPKAMPAGHSTGTPQETESENPMKTNLRSLKTSVEATQPSVTSGSTDDPTKPTPYRNTHKHPQEPMRDQSNAIREQVSFKQREEHIRDSWSFLCSHYHLNKSDLVKFLIKKEECFLRRPEAIPSGFFQGWL